MLSGSRKLLAMGLAGCGATAVVLLGGLNGESERFKARATNLIQNDLSDDSKNGSLFSSVKWDYNWDRREPHSLVKPIKGSLPISEKEENDYNEKLEKAKAVAVRHVILVRHGQYNTKGETDSLKTLTPLGREQANHVGLRLKDLISHFLYKKTKPFTQLIKSTQTRATETADIISEYIPNIPVKSCDFIREGAPIPPEPPSDNWRPSEQDFFEDGARIEAAFRKYMHRSDPTQKESSYEILVCHGNVIQYFLCRALQLPPQVWGRFGLHNCSLTWIVILPNGEVKALMVGDIGHMPTDKLTTS